MKKTLRVEPRADRDLTDHATYLAEHSLDLAIRFLAAAQATVDELLRMPEMGSPRDFKNPRLTGIRQWPIKSFGKYLVFYRPIEEGISVVRVLHGARNIPGLLTEESVED